MSRPAEEEQFEIILDDAQFPANASYFNLSSSSYPRLDSSDLEELGLDDKEQGYFYSANLENLHQVWVREPYFIPTMVIYGLASILGMIGNLLVILAMLGDRKSRSVTASFMVSLAVADLLFILVCVPNEAARLITGHWETGTAMCKITSLVEALTALASVLSLVAVSIERYIVIVHPMKARSWCTVENTKRVIPVVCVVAFALSSPTLYVWHTESDKYYNNDTSTTVILCADVGVNDQYRIIFAIYQFLIMFLVPVVVLSFCYAFVIHELWLSSHQLMQMTAHSQSSAYSPVPGGEEGRPDVVTTHEVSTSIIKNSRLRTRRTQEHSAEVLRARKQVVQMLITVIVVFLICWGPRYMFAIIQRGKFQWFYTPAMFYIKILVNLLPFVHSCLNPIIYGFMSKSFRKRLRCACRSVLCWKNKPAVSVSKKTVGSDFELESRSNCTVHTKISLRHGGTTVTPSST